MNFKGTLRLETDRLILRRYTAGDAVDMYNNWASDGRVTKYLRWLPHKSVEESEKVINELFLPAYGDDRTMLWCIELKNTHQLIGAVSVSINDDGVGDLGYCIGYDFWYKGYTTEALREVIRYAFEEAGIPKIIGYHSVHNPASGAVMRKAGLKYEGFSRSKYRTGEGQMQDCKMYGISSEEYFSTLEIGFDELKRAAQSVTGYRTLSSRAAAGSVGAAILTDKNNIYTGVCIDAACSVGFCAEQSAIAAMVTAGESRVKKVVALNTRGTVYPPCGRCREFLSLLSTDNLDAEVMVDKDTVVTLRQLLPYNWNRSEGNENAELDSERLRLVPLSRDNTAEIFSSFTPEVTTYMYPSAHKDIAETESFVSAALARMEKGSEIVYAVRLKENDEFIGLAGIHNIPTGAVELGIWTKKTAHGHGYGFEAVSRVISYVRECVPYDHMVYPVDRRNYPSRRIPVMHGGRLVKEYEVINQSGKTLEIVEYWIK